MSRCIVGKAASGTAVALFQRFVRVKGQPWFLEGVQANGSQLTYQQIKAEAVSS